MAGRSLARQGMAWHSPCQVRRKSITRGKASGDGVTPVITSRPPFDGFQGRRLQNKLLSNGVVGRPRFQSSNESPVTEFRLRVRADHFELDCVRQPAVQLLLRRVTHQRRLQSGRQGGRERRESDNDDHDDGQEVRWERCARPKRKADAPPPLLLQLIA